MFSLETIIPSKSGDVADLDNAFIDYPRDPGSDLDADKKNSVCISFESKSVGCELLSIIC